MEIDARLGLEARVLKLETECRRLRGGAGLLLLALAALPLMGQAKGGAARGTGNKTVEAQHFVVRDEQGQIRAQMGVNANGGVGLGFIGQNRLTMGVGLDGAALSVIDSSGKTRILLAIRPDGTTGLDLFSAAGKPRARMSLHSDDSPAVELNSGDGHVRASLVVLPDESAGLLLTDAAGQVRGALANEPQGNTSLDFMDKLEKRRLSLGVKAEGAPSLILFDEKGQPLERHPPGH
ncbi:MAG TPA: hypothetical protein VN083_05720 [Vicinamibacteria bacterium]|jgi:hypothetical protein|nr:hypothetical protein [Vicinamibacteria bacterium]